jgi:hypothetical protein
VGKGNIIKQDIIRGIDEAGNEVVIEGCVLGGFQTNNYTYNEDGFLISLEIIFDTIRIVYAQAQAVIKDVETIHFEWFLIEHISPHFWGSTSRSLNAFPKKSRIGIDEFDEDNNNFIGGTHSKDYFVLEFSAIKCIIAKVPQELTGNRLDGLCLEFRNTDISKIEKATLDDLKHFLSFLLGARLYYIGYSKISNWELYEAFADSPEVPNKIQSALTPIHYNLQHDWGNFALQANQLFPKYRELQNKLSLNHAIDRFWIANEIPIGVNLPVLAGAIEVVTGEYLKMTGNDQLEYLPKAEYERLIRDEVAQIKSKMATLNGGEIILNKIIGAFRKGPNEKINLFFSLLNLDTGKAEKEAINLRNKMAHGKRDYNNDDRVFDDLILTRVYQVLFNRVILKMLDYDGYYIDYSLQGCPSKPISMKAGAIDTPKL